MSVEDLKTAKELKAKLEQTERTSGSSGLVPNAPKQALFNIEDLRKKHPDKRLRWVNLRNNDKVLSRVADGWVRLPEDVQNGGRHLGDEYAVFSLPREKYEQRLAYQREMHVRRLKAFKGEFEKVVEGVARMLRDKHGLDISAEQLMNV